MKKYRGLGIILLAGTALAVLSSCSGAQSSPENVVRAWIEADVANDCSTVESLTDPTERELVESWCGPGREIGFREVRIDYVYVQRDDPAHATVDVIGDLRLYYNEMPPGLALGEWRFSVRRLDNKWYVRRW